jgi:dihydroflavonol-4-reductase
VRALLAEGRQVRALVRVDRRAIEGLDLETVEGDVSDPESLRRLVEGADTVFHLAARISIVGPEGGLVERTNVVGVRNMVDACLKAGVRRLVHFSSIHAFDSSPRDQVIDETRDLVSGTRHQAYDRSKASGQRAVMDAVRRGLDAVIVNPGGVVGPHDYKPSRMGTVVLDLYHRRLPAIIDGGFNWVDARDVAAGAITAEKKGRTGECYLLTGHWVHIGELSYMIGRLTGRKTPTFATPLWLAHAASYGSLAWGRLNGKVPFFAPGAVTSIRNHQRISHDKATRELGYEPRPFETTVRDTLDWFEQAGMLRS